MATAKKDSTSQNSLVASAQRITKKMIEGVRHGGTGGKGSKVDPMQWQKDAWELYDLVGEYRFLVNVLASRAGQARFFVGEKSDDDDSPKTTENEKALSTFESFGFTKSKRAAIIRRLTLNLLVPGEGWLVRVPDNPATSDPTGVEREFTWHMLSTAEVDHNKANDEVTLTLPFEGKRVVDLDELELIRVWEPHPKTYDEPDSPTRSALPVLQEIVGLAMHSAAQIDSRLAGAGILTVPQSAQQALQSMSGLGAEEAGDQFSQALMEAMLTPIGDRSSAAAVVPVTVTVPDESTGKFEHITFASDLDAETRPKMDHAIRRLALGFDCPPELLLGTSGMNHWGGWLVKEETVRNHIEPRLTLLCEALTEQYLWPSLIEQGMTDEEAEKFVIHFDVQHLVVRPNREDDAKELHDRGVINDDTLRRAVGFDDTDSPEIKEDTDPVQTLVIEMARKNPALIDNPGLGKLAVEVRALLSGESEKDYIETRDEAKERLDQEEEDPASDTREDERERTPEEPEDSAIPEQDEPYGEVDDAETKRPV